MKRDVDLIRKLLMEVEANPDPMTLIDPKVEGRNEMEISYHLMLMEDAGLVAAHDRSAIGIFRWSVSHLTWEGHEVLDASRDEEVWSEAKRQLGAASKGSMFMLLRQTLERVITERMAAQKK